MLQLIIPQARLFPGCTFVVGSDTIKRILDKKYYGGTDLGMVAAVAEIAALGCKFLVAGRLVNLDGEKEQFLTLVGWGMA